MTAVVQINFHFDESTSEYRTAVQAAVPMFTDMEGLLWKVWLIDEQRQEAGGIYLFASRDLAEAYADSEIVSRLRQARPGAEIKEFDDLREASALTGAAFG